MRQGVHVKRAVDTNVLVYAHVSATPEHGRVSEFLRAQLNDSKLTLVLTPLILHEFVHVVTDPRRFDPAVTIADALEVADSYLGRSNVECVPEDVRALTLAFELLRRHKLGRKRVGDTLVAACLLQAGVSEIMCPSGKSASLRHQGVVATM